MRLTCLKCGHQVELTAGDGSLRGSCVCGLDYTNPHVVNTGTCPNQRAAERSRYRAFRAAGLVKNVGGFALGMSLLGVLFFPLGLIGAAVGIYVLTMLRGPVRRYSGRRTAAIAVVLGVAVFVAEGALALSWLNQRQREYMADMQATAAEDLKALLRAERLYRASSDTFGTFSDFRFKPPFGSYTVYLGLDDVAVAMRDQRKVVDPLPAGFSPGVSENAFTAVAVANLDGDPQMDVWVLTEVGKIVHAVDDIDGAASQANLEVARAENGSEPARGDAADTDEAAAAAREATPGNDGQAAPQPGTQKEPAAVETVAPRGRAARSRRRQK